MRITIDKLVYGGAGLARTGQGVVFVDGVLPGEEVEVEITEKKKDYSQARLSAVLSASPDRTSPTCPNHDSAECCPWQYIAYDRQVAIKEAILRESLSRLGRISWEQPIATLTGPDTGYRFRGAFHAIDGRLGYVRPATNTVAPIQACPSLNPTLNGLIDEPGLLSGLLDDEEVRAVAAPEGGAWAASTGRRQYHNGNPEATVAGLRYHLHPDVFFQSNGHLLERFVATVLEGMPERQKVVFDLFSGSGFFSLPLRRVADQVVAVEGNELSIRVGQANTKLNGSPPIEWFHGHADVFLDRNTVRPDAVVLDPPRTGATRSVIQKIAELGPRRIVYISCNPTTFAPEAARLLSRGYSMQHLTLLDQFPHTYHIETIATFVLP